MDPTKIDLSEVAKVLQATTAALNSTRDRGKSRFTYYSSRHAEDIKELVTSVLNTRQPVIWPARDVSPQTLYTKWKQACDYIRTNEPDFAPKLDLVTCARSGKQGLRIAPVRDRSAVHFLPEVDWRPDFQRFVDTAEHKDKFERVIPLSDEDITWIETQLSGVEHLFIKDINDTGIVLIRYDKA